MLGWQDMKNTAETSSLALNKCISLIKAVPRDEHRIHWSSEVATVAFVASTILTSKDQKKAISELAMSTKASPFSLASFARGQNTGGSVWPELRKRLTAVKVQWNETDKARALRMNEPVKAELMIVKQADMPSNWSAADPPTDTSSTNFTTCPPLNTPNTEYVAAPDRVVAPVAEIVIHNAVKPKTLAVTANGAVSIAAPPVAAVAPSPMVAPAGDFAVKASPTRCVLDTKNNDILVITTKRIPFGSPEWCEKMVEINSKPKA